MAGGTSAIDMGKETRENVLAKYEPAVLEAAK